MKNNNWQPSFQIHIIKKRAELLNLIRTFFANNNIVEVDTPLLCQYSATAVHIDPIVATNKLNDNNQLRFLQTSPEYAMKRLLAAGSGDIFQICKAFRANELGNLHNPEFTLLEWYRIGLDHHALMQEVVELLNYVLFDHKINYQIHKIAYREIFFKHLAVDPISSDLFTLKQLIKKHINLSAGFTQDIPDATKQDCQEILFSNCIEPYLKGEDQIWIIYDYPAEQSALAKITIDQFGDPVGSRFEIYVNGLELANGYHELLDPEIQYQRFVNDQKIRTKLGKMPLEIDPYLIQALNHGLPVCSGVALGVDRLLMLKTNNLIIKDVISFSWDLA